MLKIYRKDLLLLLLGLSVGIGIGLFVVFGVDRQTQDLLMNLFNSEINPAIGSPAPEFSLISLDNQQVRLVDYIGKSVMVNFWATWCTPCRLEMPMIEKYQNRYPSDLVVLAVNIQEPATAVRIFANELDLKILVLLDPDASVSTLYKVQGLPTTYFIDRAGKIRAIHIGVLSEAQLDGYLEQIEVKQ